MFATTFAVRALTIEGAPQGPTTAVIGLRIILVVFIDSLNSRVLPTSLQWIGFIFCIMGILTLSMPDQMFELWYCLTRCQRF